ncbi:hypothetical protein D3C84_1114050 [compost metagenome]
MFSGDLVSPHSLIGFCIAKALHFVAEDVINLLLNLLVVAGVAAGYEEPDDQP